MDIVEEPETRADEVHVFDMAYPFHVGHTVEPTCPCQPTEDEDSGPLSDVRVFRHREPVQ